MDMRNPFCSRHYFLFLLVPLFASCSFFPVHKEVHFSLPEKTLWKVSVSSGEAFLVNGNAFDLSVVRNEPLALVARSVSSMKSAGAIYPVDEELKEEHSFPAQVLYSLVLSSSNSMDQKMYCLSTFNWKRFEEDCAEMGEDIWKVNKEIIMKKIAGGTFRRSDLKIEKTR